MIVKDARRREQVRVVGEVVANVSNMVPDLVQMAESASKVDRPQHVCRYDELPATVWCCTVDNGATNEIGHKPAQCVLTIWGAFMLVWWP